MRVQNLGKISLMTGDLDLLMKIGLDVVKQSIDEIMDDDES